MIVKDALEQRRRKLFVCCAFFNSVDKLIRNDSFGLLLVGQHLNGTLVKRVQALDLRPRLVADEVSIGARLQDFFEGFVSQ